MFENGYGIVNARTDLKITQALDIRAQQSEQETARNRDAKRSYGRRYDQVTIEGKLAVTSFKNKPVTVSITKRLQGKLLEAEGSPTTTSRTLGLAGVNPQLELELEWQVPVSPGPDDTVTLIYRYEVYIRN